MTKKTAAIKWGTTREGITFGNDMSIVIEKVGREYVVHWSGIRLGTSFTRLKDAKARAQQAFDHWQREHAKEGTA